MVLGIDDQTPQAAGFGGANDLPSVKLGRIEPGRLFVAKAPFLAIVSDGREIDHAIHLELVPLELALRRHGAIRSRRADGGFTGHRINGPDEKEDECGGK